MLQLWLSAGASRTRRCLLAATRQRTTAPADHVFTQVEDALRLSTGGLVVADGGENDLREYDANGNYVATWGKEGDGPGEFRDIGNLERWSADSVAVWDMFRKVLAVFDMEGIAGRTLAVSTDNNLSLAGILPNGQLVFERVTTFHFGPGQGAEQFDKYELRAYAGDGSLRRIVRVDKSATATTDAHRAGYVEECAGRGRRTCGRDVPMASHLPMFDRVIGDRLGNLWARDYDMPGSDT